jgi:hypothetical protein
MHDLPRSAASISSDDVGLIFNTLFLLLIGGLPPKSNLAVAFILPYPPMDSKWMPTFPPVKRGLALLSRPP